MFRKSSVKAENQRIFSQILMLKVLLDAKQVSRSLVRTHSTSSFLLRGRDFQICGTGKKLGVVLINKFWFLNEFLKIKNAAPLFHDQQIPVYDKRTSFVIEIVYDRVL